MGLEWEFLIFGIQGQVKTYPLADLSRLDTYEFPPLPQWDSPEMRTERATVARQKKDFLVFRCWISLLEKIFGLRPMDEVLMDLFSEEKSIIRLLDRLTAYMKKQTEYNLELGTECSATIGESKPGRWFRRNCSTGFSVPATRRFSR